MILKNCLASLILIIAVTTSANAQVQGLSLADMADSAGKGHTSIMAITIQGENSSLYGGRIAYGVTEGLNLFMDMGSYDTEYASPEIMAQFGARYTLPVELPFDLSVRGTAIPYVASYEHYIELTLGLHASCYLDAQSRWGMYGYAGIVHQGWELEFDLDPAYAEFPGQTYIDKGDKRTFSTVLGITCKLFGPTRLFTEMAHTDDYYGCAGIRFDF